MLKVSLEHLVIVVSMVLLLLDTTYGRPRRRFCENYPFSRKCLGVSAKRSPPQYDEQNRQKTLDLYSSLIKRVLDEAKRRSSPTDTDIIQSKTELPEYDDTNLFEQLVSIINKVGRGSYKRDSFIDTPDTWSEQYVDTERDI